MINNTEALSKTRRGCLRLDELEMLDARLD